jgi:hypothetical protein
LNRYEKAAPMLGAAFFASVLYDAVALYKHFLRLAAELWQWHLALFNRKPAMENQSLHGAYGGKTLMRQVLRAKQMFFFWLIFHALSMTTAQACLCQYQSRRGCQNP